MTYSMHPLPLHLVDGESVAVYHNHLDLGKKLKMYLNDTNMRLIVLGGPVAILN